MSRFRVDLGDEAQRNVSAIHDWIELRSPEGATRWYGAFRRTVEVLANEAERFSIAPESRQFKKTVRYAPFGTRSGRTYRLLFTITGSDIDVLFVRGPGQDYVKT